MSLTVAQLKLHVTLLHTRVLAAVAVLMACWHCTQRCSHAGTSPSAWEPTHAVHALYLKHFVTWRNKMTAAVEVQRCAKRSQVNYLSHGGFLLPWRIYGWSLWRSMKSSGVFSWMVGCSIFFPLWRRSALIISMWWLHSCWEEILH